MRKQHSGAERAGRLEARTRKMLHHRGKIQNHYYAAVTHNGGAAHQVGRDSMIIKRLDHQFFLAFKLVYDKPKLFFTRRDHQHEYFVRSIIRTSREPAQPNHGQHLVT